MKPELPKFPTMLRKMWSGTEVQRWIDENVAPLFYQVVDPDQPCTHKWGLKLSTHSHEPARAVCVNCGCEPETNALNAVIAIAEDHLRDATKMIEQVKVPSDAEVASLALRHEAHGEKWPDAEYRFREVDLVSFARALLAKNNHQNAYTQGFHDGVKAAGDVIKKLEQEAK